MTRRSSRVSRQGFSKFLQLLILCVLSLSKPVAFLSASEIAGTPIRAGNHPGFGRLVFDLPENGTYEIVRESARLLLVFRDAGPFTAPEKLPHNVTSIATDLNSVRLRFMPGAEPRPSQMGRMLVVDFFDPGASIGRNAAEVPAIAAKQSEEASAARLVSPPQKDGSPKDLSLISAPLNRPSLGDSQIREEIRLAVPAVEALTSTTDQSDDETKSRKSAESVPTLDRVLTDAVPVSLAQNHDAKQDALSPQSTPTAKEEVPGSSIAVPSSKESRAEQQQPFVILAPADVGAAAFRRGQDALIVLDRKLLPANLPPESKILPGPVTTTVQLPLPQSCDIRLTRVADGWSVEQIPTSKSKESLVSTTADGEVRFAFIQPGRAVTILDPVTGGALLVGTSLAADGRTGIHEPWRRPGYRILPSWIGVVVEPTSDRVDLRPVRDGFALLGGAPQKTTSLDIEKHRFDIPTGSRSALLNRLHALVSSAAASQPRSRTPDRTAAALTMIALGMGPEAEALTELVAAEDPQAANDVQIVGLKAIAAVLSGRLAEAGGLDDSRLDGTDDVELWRGLRDYEGRADTPAARKIIHYSSLALAYPAALRQKIWPLIAEASVEAGAPVPVGELSPFLLGRQSERAGHLDEALLAYQKAIAGPNWRDQVRAAERATELRFASGKVSPAQAAAELERQAYAWRGDSMEARLRLRAAELLGVAGDWRSALNATKGVEAQFPDQHDAVAKGKAVILREMLAAEGSGMSPLDVVMLAADYADSVSFADAQGAALARLLADKLMALDLPARAIPVLQALMNGAPAGESRAELGSRLAQLLLAGGRSSEALTVLDASSAPNLQRDLVEGRELLRARAVAAQGNISEAAKLLEDQHTEAADDLRAKILADTGDWHGSLLALKALAEKRVPASGPLPVSAQEVLVREAAAASQAKDQDELRTLAPSASRLTAERADLFRMLTAPPLSSPSDLPRAARELELTREVTQQLSLDRKR